MKAHVFVALRMNCAMLNGDDEALHDRFLSLE